MPHAFRWLSPACALAILGPAFASAQEQPEVFSYATYFECDPGRESRADALMRQTFAPMLEKHVAAKDLAGWGWLAHSLGGHWRRTGFMVAPSRNAVLDAQAAVLKDMQANTKAFAELSSICPRHEDYIWHQVASSQGRRPESAPPSVARAGVYFECAPARESRADTLVTEAFAPIWNRHVKVDALNSWSWHEHVSGGKYRRLLLLNGANHKQILTALDSILAQGARGRPNESREFSEICYSHQDYLWDIQQPRR
jgi:hypothetical protein